MLLPSLHLPTWQTVADLDRHADLVRRRRYGVIEMADERFHRLVLRPYPKLPSWAEAKILGAWRHRYRPGNLCRLYYNQPCGHDRFLALAYVESSKGTTLATFRGALTVLDEVARLKRADAIVCEACNPQISDRLLARWGWQPHLRSSRHRHFIKRFYGRYPAANG
jgi:hypothetical protein